MRESQVDSDPAQGMRRFANVFEAMPDAELTDVLVNRKPGNFAKRAAQMKDGHAGVSRYLGKSERLVEARREQAFDIVNESSLLSIKMHRSA